MLPKLSKLQKRILKTGLDSLYEEPKRLRYQKDILDRWIGTRRRHFKWMTVKDHDSKGFRMNSLETEYNGKQQSFYPSVSRAAKRLLARGLLEKLPYKKWRLTPLGEQTATELKRLSKNGTLRPVPSQPLRGDKELT